MLQFAWTWAGRGSLCNPHSASTRHCSSACCNNCDFGAWISRSRRTRIARAMRCPRCIADCCFGAWLENAIQEVDHSDTDSGHAWHQSDWAAWHDWTNMTTSLRWSLRSKAVSPANPPRMLSVNIHWIVSNAWLLPLGLLWMKFPSIHTRAWRLAILRLPRGLWWRFHTKLWLAYSNNLDIRSCSLDSSCSKMKKLALLSFQGIGPRRQGARAAFQLRDSLGDSHRGLATAAKGIAIRVSNGSLAVSRFIVTQSDVKFTEENRHVICKKFYLAEGFAMSHVSVISATKQAVNQAPAPLRSFNLLTWVLSEIWVFISNRRDKLVRSIRTQRMNHRVEGKD